MNCFKCEISKSCEGCLSRITRIVENSVEINKLKRKPENEFGYMLPYYVEEKEDIVEIENVIQEDVKKCSKCEVEINPHNYITNKSICRKCHNENMRNRRKK